VLIHESQGVLVAYITELLLVEKMLLVPPVVLLMHSSFVGKINVIKLDVLGKGMTTEPLA